MSSPSVVVFFKRGIEPLMLSENHYIQYNNDPNNTVKWLIFVSHSR